MENKTIELSVIGTNGKWVMDILRFRISDGVYFITSKKNNKYMFPVNMTIIRTLD